MTLTPFFGFFLSSWKDNRRNESFNGYLSYINCTFTNSITNHLVFLFRFFARLPFQFIYGLSSFFYLIIYYVLGYRKKVVIENLTLAFPEKSAAEILTITKANYRNFCDQFIETVKIHSSPFSFYKKKITLQIPDKLLNASASEKGSLLLTGHFFNWEYLGAILPLVSKQKPISIYMPLRNKPLDAFMLKMRSKFGNTLIPANNLKRAIENYNAQPCLTLLLSDQNPPGLDYCYWMPFFGREIPFHLGFDRLARRTNQTVYFAKIEKQGRGQYHLVVEELISNPAELKEGDVVKAYVSKLEAAIRAQPENWMWTHKRWKHVGKHKN